MSSEEDPRLIDPDDMSTDAIRRGIAHSIDPAGPQRGYTVDVEELERRAEQAERIVGALVRKFGDEVLRDLGWRVGLTESELTSVQDGHLRIMLDPNSGAMLIRYERPL